MANIYQSEPFPITVRIYKRLSTAPNMVWSNTYELFKDPVGEVDFTEYQALAQRLASFEQDFHLTDVIFDRAVISTHVEDGEPYNPESFVTIPLGDVIGQRAGTSDPMSLHNVLFVRKNVSFGRNGKLYYRRCLRESDVTSPAGVPRIDVSSPLYTEVATAFTTYIESLTNGDDTTFRLVMVAENQPVRNVTALAVTNVRNVKFNNRYFDVP